MLYLKYTLYLIVSILFISLIAIITPSTHQSILTLLSKKYLLLHVEVNRPTIGFNNYHIDATLDKNSSLSIDADYSDLFNYIIDADFRGDISIFSEDAEINIPSIQLQAKAKLLSDNNLDIQAHALNLDANISSNIKTYTYNLDAQLNSFDKIYALLKLPNRANGIINIHSDGNLIDTYNLTVVANDLKLSKELAKSLESNFNKEALDVKLDLEAKVNSDKIEGILDIKSSLFDYTSKSFSIDFIKHIVDIDSLLRLKTTYNKGDIIIHAKGDLNNRVQAHIYTHKLSLSKEIAKNIDASFSKNRLLLDANITGSLKHSNLVDAKIDISSELADIKSDLFHLNIEKKHLDMSAIIKAKTHDIKADLHVEAKGYYPKDLDITLSSKQAKISSSIAKSIDANFTKAYLSTDINFHSLLEGTQANAEIKIENELFKLYSHTLHVDTTKEKIDTKIELQTHLYAGDSNLSANIYYKNPIKFDAIITTPFETLSLNQSRYNFITSDFKTNYQLNFIPTTSTHVFNHESGKVEGFVKKSDNIVFELYSHDFGKNLYIHGSDKKILLKAEEVDMVKLLRFFKQLPFMQTATLDGTIEATHPNFFDFSPKELVAQTNLDITDITLLGFDLDLQLDNLKNYQNISILDGNFPGKGLLKASITSTADLVGKKRKVSTYINTLHVGSEIKNSLFTCKDCALSTKDNLVAIDGSIDITTQEFKNFKVGLLRENRCAYFVQDVYGKLSEPSFKLAKSSVKLVEGVVKSVAVLAKDTVQAVTFTDEYLQCEPFYKGVVEYPKK